MMDLARNRGVAALVSLAVMVLAALTGCGGSSSGGTSGSAGGSSTGAPSAGVSDSKAQAITEADIEVFSSANATGYLVGHPQNVRQAERLLKPLIVASTLQVSQSNSVAGGLVTNLLSELDNTTPGLTTGNGSVEQLDKTAVHRLLVYGIKKPAEVFKPRAAAGITQLRRLLAGVGANERVSLAGQQPATTARELLVRDEASIGRYWPDLARRLQALAASLH